MCDCTVSASTVEKTPEPSRALKNFQVACTVRHREVVVEKTLEPARALKRDEELALLEGEHGIEE
jgi:hypothetical protein